MTLYDLYVRVAETTGMEIVTTDSLNTAVANCFADLTSRGYRSFRELVYENVTQEKGIAEIKIPSRLRKTLYVRIQFENGMQIASRLSIGNKRIQSVVTPEGFRTDIAPREVVYYIKGDVIVVEWNHTTYKELKKIYYGYYERLQAPRQAIDATDLQSIELGIREEFEDAVVLYCVYFFYQRALKEDNKITSALNNYKYLVEDLLHELAFEDTYNDEECVILEEE